MLLKPRPPTTLLLPGSEAVLGLRKVLRGFEPLIPREQQSASLEPFPPGEPSIWFYWSSKIPTF
jgi:hypothetical protein